MHIYIIDLVLKLYVYLFTLSKIFMEKQKKTGYPNKNWEYHIQCSHQDIVKSTEVSIQVCGMYFKDGGKKYSRSSQDI